MAPYESKVASLKRALFQEIADADDVTVIEGGIGAGANLPFLSRGGRTRVIGLEPNRELAKQCAQRASAMQIPLQLEESPLGEGSIPPHLCNVVGERLARIARCLFFFDLVFNSSFRPWVLQADFAICTLLLCTVRCPSQALQELLSCVQPGGRLFFIEHVAAPRNSTLRFQQALFDPLQQAIVGGCHLTRDTAAIFEDCQDKGLVRELQYERVMIPDAALISPHIYGSASVV